MLGFLTIGMLIGLSQGVPLHGANVRIARQNEFPFVVSILQKLPNNHRRAICSGFFVSRKSVLTAAHCLTKKKLNAIEIVTIVDNHFVRSNPESWISYEKWKNELAEDKYSYNDISMITIKGEVKNAALIPASVVLTEPRNFYHSQVRMVTLGSTEVNAPNPLEIKTGLLNVITNQECREKGIKLSNNKRFGVPAEYFCTAADLRVVTNPGDSGAPILNNEKQVVGIHTGVSPSLPDKSQEFKDQNRMQTHLRAYRYADFINQTVR